MRKIDVEAASRWLTRLHVAIDTRSADLSPQDQGMFEFFVLLTARSAWKEKNGEFGQALAVVAFLNRVGIKPDAAERAFATLARPKASSHAQTGWARALKDAGAIDGHCDPDTTLRVGLHATASQRRKCQLHLNLSPAEQKRKKMLSKLADSAWSEAKQVTNIF